MRANLRTPMRGMEGPWAAGPAPRAALPARPVPGHSLLPTTHPAIITPSANAVSDAVSVAQAFSMAQQAQGGRRASNAGMPPTAGPPVAHFGQLQQMLQPGPQVQPTLSIQQQQQQQQQSHMLYGQLQNQLFMQQQINQQQQMAQQQQMQQLTQQQQIQKQQQQHQLQLQQQLHVQHQQLQQQHQNLQQQQQLQQQLQNQAAQTQQQPASISTTAAVVGAPAISNVNTMSPQMQLEMMQAAAMASSTSMATKQQLTAIQPQPGASAPAAPLPRPIPTTVPTMPLMGAQAAQLPPNQLPTAPGAQMVAGYNSLPLSMQMQLRNQLFGFMQGQVVPGPAGNPALNPILQQALGMPIGLQPQSVVSNPNATQPTTQQLKPLPQAALPPQPPPATLFHPPPIGVNGMRNGEQELREMLIRQEMQARERLESMLLPSTGMQLQDRQRLLSALLAGNRPEAPPLPLLPTHAPPINPVANGNSVVLEASRRRSHDPLPMASTCPPMSMQQAMTMRFQQMPQALRTLQQQQQQQAPQHLAMQPQQQARSNGPTKPAVMAMLQAMANLQKYCEMMRSFSEKDPAMSDPSNWPGSPPHPFSIATVQVVNAAANAKRKLLEANKVLQDIEESRANDETGPGAFSNYNAPLVAFIAAKESESESSRLNYLAARKNLFEHVWKTYIWGELSDEELFKFFCGEAEQVFALLVPVEMLTSRSSSHSSGSTPGGTPATPIPPAPGAPFSGMPPLSAIPSASTSSSTSSGLSAFKPSAALKHNEPIGGPPTLAALQRPAPMSVSSSSAPMGVAGHSAFVSPTQQRHDGSPAEKRARLEPAGGAGGAGEAGPSVPSDPAGPPTAVALPANIAPQEAEAMSQSVISCLFEMEKEKMKFVSIKYRKEEVLREKRRLALQVQQLRKQRESTKGEKGKDEVQKKIGEVKAEIAKLDRASLQLNQETAGEALRGLGALETLSKMEEEREALLYKLDGIVSCFDADHQKRTKRFWRIRPCFPDPMRLLNTSHQAEANTIKKHLLLRLVELMREDTRFRDLGMRTLQQIAITQLILRPEVLQGKKPRKKTFNDSYITIEMMTAFLGGGLDPQDIAELRKELVVVANCIIHDHDVQRRMRAIMRHIHTEQRSQTTGGTWQVPAEYLARLQNLPQCPDDCQGLSSYDPPPPPMPLIPFEDEETEAAESAPPDEDAEQPEEVATESSPAATENYDNPDAEVTSSPASPSDDEDKYPRPVLEIEEDVPSPEHP